MDDFSISEDTIVTNTQTARTLQEELTWFFFWIAQGQ